MSNASILVKKADYDTKVTEIKKNLTDLDIINILLTQNLII